MADARTRAKARAKAKAKQAQSSDDGTFRPQLGYEPQVSDSYLDDLKANFMPSVRNVGTNLKEMFANPGDMLGGMQDIAAGTLYGEALPEGNPQQQAAQAFQQEQQQRMMNPADTFRQDPAGMAMGEGGMLAPFMPKGVRPMVDPVSAVGAAGRQAGRMIPGAEKMGTALYSHSLGMGNKLDMRELLRTAKTGLEGDIPVGHSGLSILKDRRRIVGKEIGRLISEATAGGTKIDPLALANRMDELAAEAFTINDDSVARAYKHQAKTIRRLSAKKSGIDLDSPLVDAQGKPMNSVMKLDDITPTELHDYQKKLGKMLQQYFENERKAGTPALSVKKDVKADLHRTGSALMKDAVPELKGPMAEFSKNANLEAAIENTVRQRSRQQYLPQDLTLPFSLEMVTKGHPGLITGISASKRLFGASEDVLGRMLYNRAKGKNYFSDATGARINNVGRVLTQSALRNVGGYHNER